MPPPATASSSNGKPSLHQRLDAFLSERPDVVLMAPIMVYLLLLALRDVSWFGFTYEQRWITSLIRGVGALIALWLVSKHLPAWGRPHWYLAIPAGFLAAAGWVAGQHFSDYLGIPHRLPLPFFAGEPGPIVDPRDLLGHYKLYWGTITARIAVAVIAVPLVEEIFWRAFLLRALINWADFEKVPLGKFTWFSFVGTALLSTVQHPDNWAVSIFCWMAFNLLFYWKRSILFLVIVHGVTNLALYIYVVKTHDWIFW